jgi:hypothetical protein
LEGGLDLEKQTSIPVEAELFFLTSLFIELIDTDFGEEKAQACVSPFIVKWFESAMQVAVNSGRRMIQEPVFPFGQFQRALTRTLDPAVCLYSRRAIILPATRSS